MYNFRGDLDCVTLLEVHALQRQLISAKKQIKEQHRLVTKLNEENEQFRVCLNKIFTIRQIEKLLNTNNSDAKIRTKWRYDDIRDAMNLYARGAKAYKYLLEKQYPLPSIKTLKKFNNILKTYKNSLDKSVKNHFFKDQILFSKLDNI